MKTESRQAYSVSVVGEKGLKGCKRDLPRTLAHDLCCPIKIGVLFDFRRVWSLLQIAIAVNLLPYL